ncbi:DegV family protein [Weissella sagaensis]|jgi:DegV family protein with EDD domain|uniref:DegV family protein n=1 Tax=Weissella sagaensis TaxID=2559928 RepID=A0ABW1RVQ7_9LACO|nr:DegV family protein [Weissella sagaensis]KAA8433499.1 DegV family protein [Weissella paramesenteroides]MBU7568707.1 DegV family protein [Weissella hellenica]KAA8438682.1 DegV family protein [Weissella paramesenteroides]QDJ58982.1 DegV family protein [Weissella hellenica]QEA57979.1 DegV family protein [Weissella hellenica]
MKLAVVTDSTAYLSQEEIDKYDIKVVSIPVIIDGVTYREGVDITTEEFYEKLTTSSEFPTTSQPAVGVWLSLFDKLKVEGYDGALVINLASTISGTVSTVASLNDMVEDFEVYGYDSKITVRLMGHMVMKAAQMAQAGLDITEIIKTLDVLSATVDECFIVDDLQNLVRGGRLSNASAFIGTMLKIKPLLTFDNETNHIVPFEKVRSMKKAMQRAETLFAEAKSQADYPLRAIVIQGNDEVTGKAWHDELQKKYPDMLIEYSYIGPVIGAHLGKGALALAWLRDPDSL